MHTYIFNYILTRGIFGYKHFLALKRKEKKPQQFELKKISDTFKKSFSDINERDLRKLLLKGQINEQRFQFSL